MAYIYREIFSIRNQEFYGIIATHAEFALHSGTSYYFFRELNGTLMPNEINQFF